MKRLLVGFAFAILILSFSPLFSQSPSQQPVPSIEQWLSLKTILKREASPQIAPDGRLVAYSIRTAVWETNSFDDQIWIADVTSGANYQLTETKGNSVNLKWSPDSGRLAFLFSTWGGGPSQIHIATLATKTVEKLTEAPNGVDEFHWSPDGRSIAYTTTEVFPRPNGNETAEYHIVGNDPAFSSSLWKVQVSNDAKTTPAGPVQIVDGTSIAVDGFSWAPDSKRIAISASRYREADPFSTFDIYVVNVGDKSVKKIVDRPGPDFYPVWSPDGNEIAYRTYKLDNEYGVYMPGYIAVSPSGGGASRVLTENFDESPTPLAWSNEGIYFSAPQKTYQHLFRVNPKGNAIERVTEPWPSVFSSFSFSNDFKRVAFLNQDAKSSDELYVSGLTSFKPKRLTAMGDQLKNWKIGSRQVIEWKSKDGTLIEGVLIKPADFDPKKKYPLLVIIHTAPHTDVDQATITRDMPYPAEPFVAKGAIVLRPNFRGTAGYGRRFRAALVRKEGIPQVEDVVSGVDHLIAAGMVDPDRIGVMGYSAGGYIAALLATYTHRFKAVTVGAGISDLRLFYSIGAGGLIKPEYWYSKKTPWDDPEYYRKASPVTYVKGATTPVLIQHKEFDSVSPTQSAYEFRKALKDQGVPVEMIIYKGSGHQCRELKQCRDMAQQNFEWFDKWIFTK